MNEPSEAQPPSSSPTYRLRRRMVALMTIAIACPLFGWPVKRFWFSTPIGSGPAGPTVPREPFESIWTHQPVLLVGIGDSVTAGFGACPGHSYFQRLIANPPDEFPDMQGISLGAVLPRLSSLLLAQSGTTSLEHEAGQLPRLPIQPAEVFGLIVMTTGGNDLIHNYGRTPPHEGAMYGATWDQAQPWIAAFDRRLGAMLDRITSCFPGGCEILLANIYDPTDGVGDLDRAGLPAWPDGLRILDAYNAGIARHASARPNVHLIDLRATFLGHGIHCTQPWQRYYRASDPHYWYFTNLEDPNDRGYDAIRRLFLTQIASESRRSLCHLAARPLALSGTEP